MTDLWAKHAALLENSGWSERTVRWKVKHKAIRRRLSQERGANGRRLYEYYIPSLPADLQVKITNSRPTFETEKPVALVPHPESHNTQLSMFVLPPKVDREARLALTDEQQRQADYRLEVLAPLIEFRRRTNGHSPVMRLQDGRELCTIDDIVKYVAEQRQIAVSTVYEWDRRLRASGYPGLADAVRSDKGFFRFLSKHTEIAETLQTKYLKERLSIRVSYEAMLREHSNIDDLPCYETVRAYLKSLPPALVIMAREGERAFQERVEPYMLRKPPERVNQVWISDHVQHDAWVRNIDLETNLPYFVGFPLNAPLRPWMTAWLDWRSRKIVGVAWCANPSSHSISSALRVGILENGIPEEAYVDNGKDYRKLRAGASHELRDRDQVRALSPECRGVLARLNIKTTSALPYHPQSKPIESFFGNRLHSRFDREWADFYCGSSPETRPEICDEMLKEHKLFLAGKRQRSPLPSASEFVKFARHFIGEYNSVLPHSGRGMNDRTPDEVFAELGGDIRRLDDSNKLALNALFWDRQRRTVSEGGCVQIFNQRYEPADAESAARMYELIESEIHVACDPLNLGEAIALDSSGMVMGRLRSQKLTAWGPVSHEDVKASMRERHRVRRAMKEYISGLGRHTETELEARRRRAGIAEVIEAPAIPGPRSVRLASGSNAAAPDYVDDVVADCRALMEGR